MDSHIELEIKTESVQGSLGEEDPSPDLSPIRI